MPHSDNRFNQDIAKFIKAHQYQDYLDIGAGAGKYGRMIRELLPHANIEAIEADKKIIKQFKLKDFYDHVHHVKVEKFFDHKPNYTTELVIIGDCIEHLKKSDGIDLIEFLVYRCKHLIVVYPSKFVQYAWQDYQFEAHRSVWTKHDFKNFNFKHQKKKFMNLVILQGYLSDPKAIIIDNDFTLENAKK